MESRLVLKRWGFREGGKPIQRRLQAWEVFQRRLENHISNYSISALRLTGLELWLAALLETGHPFTSYGSTGRCPGLRDQGGGMGTQRAHSPNSSSKYCVKWGY